ncbi:MAG: MipA/OmpV family protein [Helicobacteraceae bacterium]|jgi:outer membrane scaffolding protein for murein synthesis (MipA/OmpV family)|nr:MipA/OmpV family protein [Helicobacteraceae bacterium]
MSKFIGAALFFITIAAAFASDQNVTENASDPKDASKSQPAAQTAAIQSGENNQTQSQDPAQSDQKPSNFRYSLGFGAANIPYFDVGGSTKIRAIPYGDLRCKAFFLSPAKGMGFDLPLAKNLIFSPALSYRSKRKEDDDKSLNGMGDIDSDYTYGAHLAYINPHIILGAKGFNGGDGGATYDFSATFPFRLAETLALALSLSPQYADGVYNRRYFGVNKEQSARSGYPEYYPEGGWIDFSGSAFLSYKITKHFSLNIFARRKVFIGEAADSPLVKRNGEKQDTFGLVFIYNSR